MFVRRLPPTLRHFAGQRVRQADDSQTQPARLAVELLLLLRLLLVLVRRPAACGALAATAVVLAEAGRRCAGGTQVFDSRDADPGSV